MSPVGNMETVIFYATFIHMGAMYLHARTFFTLADTTLYPWWRCIYMQERSEHSLMCFYTYGRDILTCKNVLYTL